MVKWTEFVETDNLENETVRFALGLTSGREFLRQMRFEGLGTITNRYLRRHGTVYLRRLARKALKRRGVLNHYNLFS